MSTRSGSLLPCRTSTHIRLVSRNGTAAGECPSRAGHSSTAAPGPSGNPAPRRRAQRRQARPTLQWTSAKKTRTVSSGRSQRRPDHCAQVHQLACRARERADRAPGCVRGGRRRRAAREVGGGPRAQIVLNKHYDGEVTEEELIGWTMERLGSVQEITGLRFVDELPKTPIGKVLRRVVRDRLPPGVMTGPDNRARRPRPSRHPAGLPTSEQAVCTPQSGSRRGRTRRREPTRRRPACAHPDSRKPVGADRYRPADRARASRSLNRWILPLGVLGSSATTCTRRG